MSLVSPSRPTIIWSRPTAWLRALYLSQAQALSRPIIEPTSARRRLLVCAENQSPLLHLISVQGDTWLASRFILGPLGPAHFDFSGRTTAMEDGSVFADLTRLQTLRMSRQREGTRGFLELPSARQLRSGFVPWCYTCGAIEAFAQYFGKRGMLGTFFFTICYFDTLHGAAFTREVNPPSGFSFCQGKEGTRAAVKEGGRHIACIYFGVGGGFGKESALIYRGTNERGTDNEGKGKNTRRDSRAD